MSIHTCIERNGAQKQLPLVFCLMSQKTKSDYLAVFRSLQSRLGHVSLEGFILDLEKAAWIELKGCAFHWSQAVWRHIQTVGLAKMYMQGEGLHSSTPCPSVPAQHSHMSRSADAGNEGYNLCYTDPWQWLDNPLFPAEVWSVYRQKE